MTIKEEYLEAKQNLRMANVMNDYNNEAHFVVACYCSAELSPH